MAIIDKVKSVYNAFRAQPADPQKSTVLQFIGGNNANVRVTPEIALMVSAVWACIDVISSSLSSSDWNVYSGYRGDGNQEYLPNDVLQYILNTRPNSEMTAQSFKRAMMIAAVGWGNGYAEIERDMAGRVVGLYPLRPDRVELKRDLNQNLFYRVYGETSADWVDLLPREVLHIRGAGVDGLLGDNPLARAVQSISMSVALDQFGAAYFANNTQMGVVLEYTGLGKIDDNTYDRLKQSWEERHKGARKSFRVGFIEGGMKLHQLEVQADKAQLVEAKYQQIEEIARFFRVPPHKIGHLLRSTNNNIEHQGLEFSRETLRPWVKEIEQESDFKLIPYRTNKFVCIDIDWASEGDFKSRVEGFQILRNIGVFSANDILKKIGENTIGAEGDIRIVQGAMIPLERVGEAYTPTPKTTEPEPTIEETNQAVTAWLTSIYARIQKRHDNRLADLTKNKVPDAESKALSDAVDYAESQLSEIMPLLTGFEDKLTDGVQSLLIDKLSPNEVTKQVMENK
jgi:HK97 family phage portal protein